MSCHLLQQQQGQHHKQHSNSEVSHRVFTAHPEQYKGCTRLTVPTERQAPCTVTHEGFDMSACNGRHSLYPTLTEVVTPTAARLRKNEAMPSWVLPDGVVSWTTAQVMCTAPGCAAGALLML